jgi:hypothetical protein
MTRNEGAQATEKYKRTRKYHSFGIPKLGSLALSTFEVLGRNENSRFQVG